MNSRFNKGSGCYTCQSCGKKTRDVNREEGAARLCSDCYEKAGDENAVTDGLMTQQQFDSKWSSGPIAGASRGGPCTDLDANR